MALPDHSTKWPAKVARGTGVHLQITFGVPEGYLVPRAALFGLSFSVAYRTLLRNALVLSCFGFLKNSAGGASSTNTPPSMKSTRSATSRANPIS